MRCARVIIALAVLSRCQGAGPESGNATAERATAADASPDSGKAAADRPRAAEAPQDARRTTAEHAKAAGALTPQASKEAAVTEAQQVAADAAGTAEAKIASLRTLLQKVEADLRNETFLLVAADDIISKAVDDHKDEREKAKQLFEHRLRTFNATLRSKANASDVHAAFTAAKEAEKELAEADKATAHAMSKGYKVAAHAKMAAIRTLAKEAQEAAKHAKKSGSRVAKAQRAAGMPEHVYERTQGHSEKSAEELQLRAELIGEQAEGVVEQGSGRLEHLVESQINLFKDAAAEERHQLHWAEHAMKRARDKAARAAQTPWRSGLAPLALVGSVTQAAAETKVAEVREAAGAAAADAQTKVDALQALLEKAEADARNTTLPHAVANSIISKALQEHKAEHERAEQHFKDKLRALNVTILAQASTSDVSAAVSAAEKAQDEVAQVDRATLGAMRKGFKGSTRAKMDAVRALKKIAQKAARHALKSGREVAKAQRVAGTSEEVYEPTEHRDEKSGEELEHRAEHVGEAAEGAVEQGSGQLEHLVEDRMDSYRDAAADDAAERRRELRLAEHALAQARKEATAAAAVAAAQAPVGDAANGTEKPASQAFLAGAAPDKAAFGMSISTACAMSLAATAAVAISWKSSRRSVRVGEAPALG